MYWKIFVITALTIASFVEIKCGGKNKVDYHLLDGPIDQQNIYGTESSVNNEELNSISYEDENNLQDEEYEEEEDADYDIHDDIYDDYYDDDDYDYQPINYPKLRIKKKNKKKKNYKKKTYKTGKKNQPQSVQLKKFTEDEEEDNNDNETNKIGNLISDLTKIEINGDTNGPVCSLKLNQDISKKNEPLFLVKDTSGKFKLDLPNLIEKDTEKYSKGIDAIQFDKERIIYIECPGKNNKISAGEVLNDNASIEMKCVAGSTVSLQAGKENKVLDSSQLKCLKPVTGRAQFREGKKYCGNNEGVLIELGFPVKGWHKLIDVCFNVKEIKTLYTKHKLYGSVLAGAVVDSNRPNFNKGSDYFYKGFNPDSFYKKENQNQTISGLYGDNTYFDPESNLYLARGHFAPDADFIFKSWQDLTYFFVNVAPQWQSINQGHWLSVERLTRNIAMKLGEDLDVVTGPFGIMQIAGKKLYLKIDPENKIKKKKNKRSIPDLAVPNYYWKLIHRPIKNECIVLISTNNPFVEDDSDGFWNDICEENVWPSLKDAKKGFVSCSSYDDFKKTVLSVPNYDCSGGILKGP